ncbi:unnamed protein product [Effrenium voratum]|nr:unnamed protein product [Effrenium voratum]
MLAGYLLSFLNGDERRPGSRRSLFLLAAVQRFWNAVLPFFFNIDCKVEDIEELRACDQCVVAVHPHGVLSFGHYLLISGFHPDLEKALPARRRCALSAGVIFKLPVVREIALGMGCVDAHRDIAERCLCGGSPSDLCLHDKNYFLAPPSVWSRRACAERSGKRDHWHGPSRPFIGEPPEHLAWIFGAIFTSFDQLSAADIKQLAFVVRFSACAPWNGKVSSADFR